MHKNIDLCRFLDLYAQMPFRSNDSAEEGLQKAYALLINSLEPSNRNSSRVELDGIISRYGPVVESYPSWHPLVSHTPDLQSPVTYPSRTLRGLDHTVLLRNGIISCPYDGAEEILDLVSRLPFHEIVSVSGEKLDFPLYSERTTAIFIRCDWNRELKRDGSIPPNLAIPLMLEMELKSWTTAHFAESWETMRSYLLGRPCGGRSSLFLDQEAGQALKKVWQELIKSGAFGPPRY
jgi:hypothetical protein